jgi:hypothetical protein
VKVITLATFPWAKQLYDWRGIATAQQDMKEVDSLGLLSMASVY